MHPWSLFSNDEPLRDMMVHVPGGANPFQRLNNAAWTNFVGASTLSGDKASAT